MSGNTNSTGPYRIGIDLGGTNIKAGVLDGQNNILGQMSLKTNSERPWQEVVEDMVHAVNLALEKAKLTAKECVSLGVGSPGTIDSMNGVVVYANNLGWENVPIAKRLREAFDLPVRVSNDANCAALGEAVAGAAKGCAHVVLITLGTGVGSGFIVDGKVFEGGGPGSAEFGHNVIIDGGEMCTCGRSGCFEAYASATALVRDARTATKANPSSLMNEMCKGELANMNGRIPFDAARQDDATALAVVKQYIHYLAVGVTNAINVFRPDMVLLSGGICKEGTYLTDPLCEEVKTYVYGGGNSYLPKICSAQLGNDAGLIGAAHLS